MATITLLASSLAALTAAVAALSNIELWQRKEYRWDRLRSFLKSPEFSVIRLPFLMLATLAFISAIALQFFNHPHIAEYLAWFSVASILSHYIRRGLRRGLSRPVVTAKATLNLAVLTILLITFVLTFYDSFPTAGFLWSTLLMLLPLFAGLTVVLVNVPTHLRKRSIIQAATKRRTDLPQLTVVGITGSWGKTSTKYFLNQLLQPDPHVLMSLEHRNAELPVAQDMLRRLQPDTTIYLAEMGAYQAGEIAALAALTRPQIGIITAIGNQHLDLFGSLENIVAAKWELIAALPPDGLAILNADDPIQVKKAAGLSQRIMWYSLKEPKDVWMENIVINPTNIQLDLHVSQETKHLALPLVSEALLTSVLAAVTGAVALGKTLPAIAPCLQQLKPFSRTMEIKTGRTGLTIIDDSYSANEAGTVVALRHLQRFPQQNRIVVMVPLMELGPEGPAAHERISRVLAETGATTYIYGRAYFKPSPTLHLETDPKRLADTLRKVIKPGSVVLLEGRLPDVVKNAVL